MDFGEIVDGSSNGGITTNQRKVEVGIGESLEGGRGLEEDCCKGGFQEGLSKVGGVKASVNFLSYYIATSCNDSCVCSSGFIMVVYSSVSLFVMSKLLSFLAKVLFMLIVQYFHLTLFNALASS